MITFKQISSRLVEDLIHGLLQSDGYFGQSNLPQDQDQSSSIFNTPNFNDERIRQMVEPAYIIIENDLSEQLSKIIETAAINTPLRNLPTVQKRSANDEDQTLNASLAIII